MSTLWLQPLMGLEGKDEGAVMADYEDLVDELMKSYPELNYWLLDDKRFEESLMLLGRPQRCSSGHIEDVSNSDSGANITETHPLEESSSASSSPASVENPRDLLSMDNQDIKQLNYRLADSMMRSHITRSRIISQREAMLAVQQIQGFDEMSLRRLVDAIRQGEKLDSQSCQYLSKWFDMIMLHNKHQLHSLMSTITFEILIQLCFS
jgi:hypothetical protein